MYIDIIYIFVHEYKNRIIKMLNELNNANDLAMTAERKYVYYIKSLV